MKPVDELTPDELRREIAERLGYTLKKKNKGEDLIFTILSPKNHIIRQATVKEDTLLAEALVWLNLPHWHIPDWPNDTGAAYLLCVDVLDRLNESDPRSMWNFETGTASVSLNRLAYGGGIRDSYGQDGRDAEALARLALLALREGGE